MIHMIHILHIIHNRQHTHRLRCFFFFLRILRWSDTLREAHGYSRRSDGDTGSARRRRERRLRSWLRHEQQLIAAVLATVTHHSFNKVGTASGVLRNLKTATRTREGENEKNYSATVRETPLPSAPGTQYFVMTPEGIESVPALGGERPAALQEPRPQLRDWRHTGVGHELVLNLVLPLREKEVPEVRAAAFIRAVEGDGEDMRHLAAASRARKDAEKAAAPLPTSVGALEFRASCTSTQSTNSRCGDDQVRSACGHA